MTSHNRNESDPTPDEPPSYDDFRERARHAPTGGAAEAKSYPLDFATRRAAKEAENRLRSIKLPTAALNDATRTLRTHAAVHNAAADQILRIAPTVSAPLFTEQLAKTLPPLFTVHSPSLAELTKGMSSLITTHRSFSEQVSEGFMRPLITAYRPFSEQLPGKLSEGIMRPLITAYRPFSEQLSGNLSEGFLRPLITSQRSMSELLKIGFPSSITTHPPFAAQLFSWQTAWEKPMRALLDSVQESLVPLRNLIGEQLAELSSLSAFGNIVGRIGLLIARRARDAAIRLDDEDREFLGWFMRVWLGIKKVTVLALEATAAALLDPSWDTGDPRDVIADIRGLVTVHKRGYRPLWDTKIKKQKIAGLDREVINDSGGVTTLVELVPARTPTPESVYLDGEYTDPRLLVVLEKLNPVEQAILEAKSRGGTWEDAAIMCGQDLKRGEAVRRKVRRISNRTAS